MNNAVGVVGLGKMGSGIAARLLESGLVVYGFDLYKPSVIPAGLRWVRRAFRAGALHSAFGSCWRMR